MVKRLNVMGVQLNVETVDELRLMVQSYFSTRQMNTIAAVSMRMLMMAQKEAEMRDVLNAYDLALPGEVEILQHINYRDNTLYREIRGNDFFDFFMELLTEEKRTIYLLGETEFQKQDILRYLQSQFPEAKVVGAGCLNDGREITALINEINILAPEVILSVIPSPNQERFVKDRKSMIDAKVWYGLNNQYRLNSPTKLLHARAQSFIQKLSFRGIMESYHKENNEK